ARRRGRGGLSARGARGTARGGGRGGSPPRQRLRADSSAPGVTAGRIGKPTLWKARAISVEQITSRVTSSPSSRARRRQRRGINETGKKKRASARALPTA